MQARKQTKIIYLQRKKIVSENVKNEILKSMRKFSDLRIDYLANYF